MRDFDHHHGTRTRDTFDREYRVRNDGQIHLGAINLDSMDLSDLEIAAEHPALHSDVKVYAAYKARAVAARRRGDITFAILLERGAERCWLRIPERCRW